jgi:hypothetical protein
MKRKLFTLLLAFVALATFQVNAQTYWIRVDTSAYTKNAIYSADQTDFDNWLVSPAATTPPTPNAIKLNATGLGSIFESTPDNYFVLEEVSGIGNRFKLAYRKGLTGNLTYVTLSGDASASEFEIVGFDPATRERTTRAKIGGQIEGYLVPAQQGTGSNVLLDNDPDLLFVVSDKDGNLTIKKFFNWSLSYAPFVAPTPDILAVADDQGIKNWFYDGSTQEFFTAPNTTYTSVDALTPADSILYFSFGNNPAGDVNTEFRAITAINDLPPTGGGAPAISGTPGATQTTTETFTKEIEWKVFGTGAVLTTEFQSNQDTEYTWTQDISGATFLPVTSLVANIVPVGSGGNVTANVDAFNSAWQALDGHSFSFDGSTDGSQILTLSNYAIAPYGAGVNLAATAILEYIEGGAGFVSISINRNTGAITVTSGTDPGVTALTPGSSVLPEFALVSGDYVNIPLTVPAGSGNAGGTAAFNARWHALEGRYFSFDGTNILKLTAYQDAPGGGGGNTNKGRATFEWISGGVGYVENVLISRNSGSIDEYGTLIPTALSSGTTIQEYSLESGSVTYDWVAGTPAPATAYVKTTGDIPNFFGGEGYVAYRYDQSQYVDINEMPVPGHDFIPGTPGNPLASGTYKTPYATPLYIKTETPAGRWATAEDFADCRYLTLDGNSANLATKFGLLSGKDNYRPGSGSQTLFAVQQVDYRNLTNYTAAINRGGLQGDTIVPLFTLSAPGDTCKVLSVSKYNKLTTQTEGDNAFADYLELRPYGYEYFYKTGTDTDAEALAFYNNNTVRRQENYNGTTRQETARSLQKFGIWINLDNTYTIYPEAAYSFKYGEAKWNKTDVASNYAIDNNYNPASETALSGLITGGTPDAKFSWKIGKWDGTLTSTPHVPAGGYIGVVPAILQTTTVYSPVYYTRECGVFDPIAEKRFYFLSVQNFSTAADSSNLTWGYAFKKDAYQYNREYVLATVSDASGKYLEIVPKEKLAAGLNPNAKPGDVDANYWNNTPYDSVNMAAHWEVIAKDGGYIFVNQLRDTLQYNTAVDLVRLTGGYLTQKTITSVFEPESGKYFAKNLITHATSNTTVWKANKLKNKGFGIEGAFYLESKEGYTLQPDAGWLPTDNDLGLGSGVGAKYYWHKPIGLIAPPDYPLLGAAPSTCAGLLLKLDSIPYVPTFSSSYDLEAENGIINTNDPYFIHNRVGQDSLTAYLLLDGYYDIKEALSVNNSLVLGPKEVPLSSPKVLGASFIPKQGDSVQFIPLANSAAKAKLIALKDELPAGNIPLLGNLVQRTNNVSKDALYGETYKWNIVKSGDKYLVYDTLSLNGTNELKQGFVFKKVDEINATPIRLYQPLVGDVTKGNFIIQFYPAIYNYKLAANKIDYEIDNLKEYVGLTGTNTPANPEGGKLNFGKLSGGQSDFILGTTDIRTATRLTYVLKHPEAICPDKFIAPSWLAERKLLGLPLENDVYHKDSIVAHIAVNKDGEAVLDTTKATDLKFTYIGKISKGKLIKANVVAAHKLRTFNDVTWSISDSTFVQDLEVPLYFVQNSDGKYLTVSQTTDQYNQFATYNDVTGVTLVWGDLAPSYDYTKHDFDYRALQAFAISGCGEEIDYGKFVFLPLASYKIDYTKKTKAVLTDEIYYNTQLGAGNALTLQNDVTKAYRIGQYVIPGGGDQKLIVSNASATDKTSNIAVEFAVKPKEYLTPNCHHYLVQRADDSLYYTVSSAGLLKQANEYSVAAHWSLSYDEKDQYLATFAPELKVIYDTIKVEDKSTLTKGSYYFVAEKADTLGAYGFEDMKAPDWQIIYKRIVLTCVDHATPFLDLGDVHGQELAILEDIKLDRNLTDNYGKGTEEPVYRGGAKAIFAYRAFLNQILPADFENADKVIVYEENKRYLSGVKIGDEVPVDTVETSEHVIPYYSFSITKGDKEYFLNVDEKSQRANKVLGTDSVYWTELTDAQKAILLDPVKYPKSLPTYKFCLPYKLTLEGEQLYERGQKSGDLPAVYLQTLDTIKTEYPYLVIAGAATTYVTTVKLDNALLPGYGVGNILADNIYTMDYSKVDYQTKATAWVFGQPASSGKEWVPLLDHTAGTIGSTTGVLTDYLLGNGGTTFIDQSGKVDPLNYGIITGVNNGPTLKFTFEGEATIGKYIQRPIYYYRIQLDGTDLYLTDAKDSTAQYPFNGKDYSYGFFGDIVANHPAYVNGTYTPTVADAPIYKITADSAFAQTFGFKYVTDKEVVADAQAEDVQAFYVVSHADYTHPKNVDAYRYLAEVNNHLVFVDNVKDALVFQFGHIDDNIYTDVKAPVAKSGIIAIVGGVKVIGGEIGDKVDIYSVDGRLVKSTTLSSADQTITTPKGVLIVKTAGKVAKVIVK